ncbi:hypothetical protein MGAS11027_0504 [Streptococcus pyogenes]|nr:hypothetical protein MGAS11027_0504 [Streptococcus pyogenes]ANC25188.1 hypothetical protein MGAS23530_0499 [Streptococcus pyogenes]ANC26790.1 hypothetical protein MGAS27061_0507 [Streptococcus pyogenes]BAV54762.1 hypothetical protein JMUB1235_0503 [Streptococcus pyogenes]
MTHSPIILSSFEKISYCDIQLSKKNRLSFPNYGRIPFGKRGPLVFLVIMF